MQAKAGFVPNVFLALAHRPASGAPSWPITTTLLLEGTRQPPPRSNEMTLTKGEREMIIVATSAVNHCLYCVVAHGAILRIYEKKPLVHDQVAINHRAADPAAPASPCSTSRSRSASARREVEDADFEALRPGHVASDDDIWDIAGITAFFSLSNRTPTSSHAPERRVLPDGPGAAQQRLMSHAP